MQIIKQKTRVKRKQVQTNTQKKLTKNTGSRVNNEFSATGLSEQEKSSYNNKPHRMS